MAELGYKIWEKNGNDKVHVTETITYCLKKIRGKKASGIELNPNNTSTRILFLRFPVIMIGLIQMNATENILNSAHELEKAC